MDCHNYLGGDYNPEEKALDALLISDNFASVRKNVTGAPIRVIVDLEQNKVFTYPYDHVTADITFIVIVIVLPL